MTVWFITKLESKLQILERNWAIYWREFQIFLEPSVSLCHSFQPPGLKVWPFLPASCQLASFEINFGIVKWSWQVFNRIAAVGKFATMHATWKVKSLQYVRKCDLVLVHFRTKLSCLSVV